MWLTSVRALCESVVCFLRVDGLLFGGLKFGERAFVQLD